MLLLLLFKKEILKGLVFLVQLLKNYDKLISLQ